MKNDFGLLTFPHSSLIQVGSHSLRAQEVIELMNPFLSGPRVDRIEKVVRDRTFSVVTVLENLYDRGNMSAVMRSAEAMGFQNLHVIEPGDKFKKANRVTKGADKWLDVTQWKTTEECISFLKSKNYKIYATHLDAKARPIQDVDWSVPAALVLGNEKDGISPEMQALCDQTVIIPMQGFVQSFNISVAGAIALFHIHEQRNLKLGASGDLNQEQQQILKALFFLRSAKNPERLIERLLNRAAKRSEV
jgi:tRNA (guanosine-2'-O-)-methyltransferase